MADLPSGENDIRQMNIIAFPPEGRRVLLTNSHYRCSIYVTDSIEEGLTMSKKITDAELLMMRIFWREDRVLTFS
ncbi:MAG: hypothetical protein LBJ99_00110, partial [Oscillospiraceae bacterium]|nr:hypothetical protein [Oscillospiraceae bacterium]